MNWNQRVVLTRHPDGDRYAVHEVYYNEHGEPRSCTVDPVAPQGETMDELRAELSQHLAALEKPIIDMAIFDAIEAESEAAEKAEGST